MDGNLKSEWLKALRSGEYEQGQGYLRDGNKFCCLGVACDVLDKRKWSTSDNVGWAYGDGICVWPNEVQEQFGVTYPQASKLWNMNDTGKSFAEIADYIEANL